MYCNKCKKLAVEKGVKVGFRDECYSCGADLHTCSHCRYYSLGKPNDCLVPGTDFVRNREANNFCEDFKPKITPEPPEKRIQVKNKFDSLFKDE